jgi:hypothetical protein
MTHEICAYDDCNGYVNEDDYCEECGCYICEEHNTNLDLSFDHLLEDHWAKE